MRIAILGGGFTGLTAAYYLSKKGHSVTIFEKEAVLGGLASGFKPDHWNWPLERAYHHLFASDSDILNFAKEVGFEGIFFQSPRTDSLYLVDNPPSPTASVGTRDYRIFPVDTPQDFLKLPLLSYPEKLRAASILGFLKFSPFLPIYERYSAEQFVRKTMGERAWKVLFQQLFRKKFGKYAGNILASFVWARITKRTKQLGYVEGGFQTFIEYLEKINREAGVTIEKNVSVDIVTKEREMFKLQTTRQNNSESTKQEPFDAVISTLPTPILTKIAAPIFSQSYLKDFEKLKYLHALVLILETKEPILEKTYWLNICAEEIPMMLVAQHTNFVDKKYYGGNHISYIGYYLERDDPLMKKSKEELIEFLRPYVKKISGRELTVINAYHFRAPFAQPIFDAEFVKYMPHFETPVKNFYIANLDMTYPYDRGTNYAVKLGKEVAAIIR